jgi:asparagine synthase (glutamine-hydrolysing)
MCGIVAALGRFDEGRVRRALDVLAPRGPDGAGVFRGPEIMLGHRRLAILDLAGGHQPLASEDGAVHLVVNGELYATARARTELEARGHVFATKLDSEVLLHLYEERGADAVHALRGEFAFVLWDARKKLLVAGRDRFGVKPIAYAEHDGALYLASQAKALFAAGVPAAWDERALFQAASAQYTLPGTTLFRGVRQLPPGHLLLARDGQIELLRYWDIDFAREEEHLPTDSPSSSPGAFSSPKSSLHAHLDLEFRARFFDAVRTRLVADVPIAFQLSGGLDSSAVASVAAERGPIDCFTVAFDRPGYDESGFAREVARHIGARLHVVPIGVADVVRELPAAIAASEGLVINAHAAAKHALSRAIRNAGFKVVLTGEGADEVLAGYAHLRADLGLDVVGTNDASRGVMLPEGDALPTDAVRARLGYVPTWLAAKATFGRRVRALFSDDWGGKDDPFEAILASVDLAQLAGRGRVEQSSYLWAKLALEGYILRTLGDGMEMAHGVEGRLPFLDHELFDLVRRAPTSRKIERGIEKAILRRAMEGRLPSSVLKREKHPFLAPPFFAATNSPLRPLLLDLLRAAPMFDRAKVEALLASDAPATAVDPALFFILSTCILQTSFGL